MALRAWVAVFFLLWPFIFDLSDARKSLLYCNDETWVKKGESNFDVSMGAYDEAEVCELIGIFMFSLLSKHINKNHIGQYRDDGLAI